MVYYRRLPRFKYLSPGTIEETLVLLREGEGNSKIIAGGTDLLVQMKHREISPDYLISLKKIRGLDFINYTRDGLRFGALCTIGAIENSRVVQDKFGVLSQAVYSMASPQIRNVATVAGNICSAVPSADTAPALIVLDATLKLCSPGQERTVAVEEFFRGPRMTVLNRAELLTEIHVPDTGPRSKGIYLKYGLRKAMSLATVGVAVMITLEDSFCQDIRIALGAVAPTPLRAKAAETVLRGKVLIDSLIEEAARTASEEARPISDIRASADYRSELVRVLTRRAIHQACAKF